MTFTPFNWQNDPSTATPISAEALEDLESRLAAYSEAVGAGGVELGYAQITADFTQTGAGNNDVTGLSVTVTVGTRPILITVECSQVANSSASGLTHVRIMESSTVLQIAPHPLDSALTPHGIHRSVRLAPTAGSHTYKVNLRQVVTGNSAIFADALSVYGPASLQVLEV